jgi:haloacetate dehalogenase
MADDTRRDLLRKAATLGAGIIVSGADVLARAERLSQQTDRNAAASQFFPGFKQLTKKTSGATINFVMAGSGPPLLLLHGYPETHIMWRKVAPQLAKKFTVVVADLRGYGDSSKPAGGGDHAAYSKRAMAQDQLEVMNGLGFQKFLVVGHDRGGRVAHRMALDHADSVQKLVVLDIVPTYKVFHTVTKELATSNFHWFFLIQPEPLPETMIGNSAEVWLKSRFSAVPADAISKEAFAEYLRAFRTPEMIHATCEDYRASASIDMAHDEADLQRKISCPVLALWAEKGAMDRQYKVLETWKERASNVSGKPLPSSHFIAEQVPEMFLAELGPFLG